MPRESISPIDVYKLLPRTNCKECGEENCMAFATKLVNREVILDQCKPLLQGKYKESYQKLWELIKPPIKEVIIGKDDKAVKIGGKLVMYRHELTYTNPTAMAIDVTDETSSEEISKRAKWAENFAYEYIGQRLKLDLLAVRSTSDDPQKFKAAVNTVIEASHLPIILCSLNPEVMESGLLVAAKRRPLIYAATKSNWKEMADLAIMYACPLVVYAPNDLKLLRSLVKTLLEYGVSDLVLDTGTFLNEGLADTINNLTMIRKAACKEDDELFGFPIISTPIVAWAEKDVPEISMWNEAYLTSILINRYSDALIIHSAEGWALLPNIILRQNIYTDPRKPVAVEPGLKVIGEPDANAPLMFTTNFALTYFTVASDIESSKLNCYLLVVDTGGLSVESSVAGRKLTAEGVAEAIKKSNIEGKIKHKKLIIPGRAARLKGELEDQTGWEIIVGPIDSSDISKFIQEKWVTK